LTEASSERPPASANFINPETVHPPFGYSHVVEVTAGRPVYIAGQVALDPAGTLVGADDIRAQTRQVFNNLRAALEAVEPASSRSSSSTSTWSTPPSYR
jgi:enamine deaminase RidA (YjgF/YER057c/UK114 family)